jgi:hypothetical protein
MHKELLAGYGFKLIARVWIEDDKFRIDVTDTEAEKLSYSVYAFVIDGEIVRIGSSAAQLKRRLAAWRRDISVALAGGKSAAPLTEAEQWLAPKRTRRTLRSSSDNGGDTCRQVSCSP